MLIKFLLVCGAPGGVLRQSEPLLLQEVFFFPFFWFCADCRAWSRLSKKSSHVTLRRSVCFHRVGSNPTKTFQQMFRFFFFLPSTNWTLPQNFPACLLFKLARQLHRSDFTSPRKLSSSILAGSDRQLVFEKGLFLNGLISWLVEVTGQGSGLLCDTIEEENEEDGTADANRISADVAIVYYSFTWTGRPVQNNVAGRRTQKQARIVKKSQNLKISCWSIEIGMSCQFFKCELNPNL